MNTPEVRPHPQGGHTIAVPVPGSATARVYVGQYITRERAALELAKSIGRIEGLVLLQQMRRGGGGMTIHVVRKGSSTTAERKARRGVCITPHCTRPPRNQERLCARCRDRIWRARHPEHHLWNNLKKSAKRRGVAFTVTLEEFVAFCQRENFVAKVGRGPEDATIDRRDPTLGYSADNLRVLTNAENGRLGAGLAGSGHRLEGQEQLPLESAHYTPEENPLLC